MNHTYSMKIEWSDEDQTFVVTLAEFGPYAKTHGDTYEEAVRKGREAIESLIEAYEADGQALPEPARFQGAVPAKTKVA
jgi:predicted RNase H-like HicB family nuclease